MTDMKKLRNCLIMLAMLCLLLGMAQAETAEDYAGLYPYLGYYVNGQFVRDEGCETWSVTLKADGSGSLYWGEDNKGPISDWSITDGALVIHAGVSEIEGVIANGVMLLDMGDGYILGWAGRDTDYDALQIISPEDFMRQRWPAEHVGSYHPFATTAGEYIVAIPQAQVGTLTLNADGSVEATMSEGVKRYSWGMDGDTFYLMDEAGSATLMMGTLTDGILIFDIPGQQGDEAESAGQTYYAREGADTSAIETIALDDYRAMLLENNS